MIDVLISYARVDSGWAADLAGRLRDHGLRVFLEEWSVTAGDIMTHELERAISESACAVAVITPASLAAPWAREEYAALVEASTDQRLRFIPVLAGDVAMPPFAANRVWCDFRDVAGQAYEGKVAELAAVISSRARPGSQQAMVREEDIRIIHPTPPRPITEPSQRNFVVCFAPDDARYSRELIGSLREAGLPVWSVADLRPGDAHFWIIRQQLTYAIAVIVVMSPHSQNSDDITRMILEGVSRGRPFVPFLLHGDVNYHLASTWHFDARGGRLPDAGLLGMLRRLHSADAAGEQVDPAKVLPPPIARPLAPAVRVPRSAGLDQLNRYLREREFEYADLLTTTLILESANRLGEGWMRERDGRELPLSLIAGIDALWSRHSDGRQGFRAQRAMAPVRRGRHAEFLALSAACGWQDGTDGSVCRNYGDFIMRAAGGGRAGFFPTLRNPQSERHVHWYDLWEPTVLAIHLRLQEWKETA